MESRDLDSNEKENLSGANRPLRSIEFSPPSNTGVEIEIISEHEASPPSDDGALSMSTAQPLPARSPLTEKAESSEPSHEEAPSMPQERLSAADQEELDKTVVPGDSLSSDGSSPLGEEADQNRDENDKRLEALTKEGDRASMVLEQPDASGNEVLSHKDGLKKAKMKEEEEQQQAADQVEEEQKEAIEMVNIVQDLAKGDESCVERPGIFGLMAKSDIFNPHSFPVQAAEGSPAFDRDKTGKTRPFSKEEATDIKYTTECLQDALPAGKKIPLREEIVGRPPFRFIHDITMAILGKSVFTEEERDSHLCGQSKLRKLAWLAKLREIVQVRTKSSLDVVRLGKVVAGKETANTRFLLRMICKAGEQESTQLNSTQSPRIQVPNPSEILAAAEADPNRRRSMLALQTHLADNAKEIKAKKLRINVNMELLDGELQQAIIARLNLLQSICHDPSHNDQSTKRDESCDGDSTHAHAILLEHHIRTVASAYSMANQMQNCTKSQSLRRASDPQEGNGQRNTYLRQATHLYVSPFDKPAGHGEVAVASLPKIIFDKSALSCLCVLSLTRLGLRNSAFPDMPVESLPTFLTVLDFSHNLLTGLPKIFSQCWKLVEIRLRDNRIAALDVGNLKCLVLLDIRKNPIPQKPDRLDQCSNLRYLYMKDGQPIKFPFAKIKPGSKREGTPGTTCSTNKSDTVEDLEIEDSSEIIYDKAECLDLSDCDILKALENRNLKQVAIVLINVEQLLIHSATNAFIPGKDTEVLEVLMQLPNVWQFWVYSGEFSFSKQVVKDSGVHYLGLKPYDEAFDPPVYLPLLHRWLMQGFDIVNCALCKKHRLCKFTIIPFDGNQPPHHF